MKKAIILAAGVGKRLGNLTQDIPKCLLPIDSGKVLIDFSLEALRENNIVEVIFISGFAHEKLKSHIEKKWSDKFSIKFIFNEKYSDYNNIYSAYLAKDIWDDDTVLLNSDIIYHPLILKNLLSKSVELEKQEARNRKQENHASSFLVIDNTKELTDEAMKVEIDNDDKIKKISKNLNSKISFGEYIGITYLRSSARIKFLRSLEENVKAGKLDIYYEDALAQVLNGISVFPSSTCGKVWTEVDTKEDYEIAKKIAQELNESNKYSI